MEVLGEVLSHQNASLLEIWRFAIVSFLTVTLKMLLLFPINIIIFFLIMLLTLHCLFRSIFPRSFPKENYKPLIHTPNMLEEVKAVKDQVREIQHMLREKSRRMEEAAASRQSAMKGTTHEEEALRKRERDSVGEYEAVSRRLEETFKDVAVILKNLTDS